MDRESTNGGDRIGSVAIAVRKPLQGTLVRVMV